MIGLLAGIDCASHHLLDSDVDEINIYGLAWS